MSLGTSSQTRSALRSAHAHFREGRFTEAAAGYLRVVELSPAHADAWCLLGTSLAILGHPGDAEVALRTALKRCPGHVDALANLGKLLLDAGQTHEAIDLCFRAIQALPTHFASHLNLASALLAEGRLAEAEVHARRAIEIDPGAAGPHDLLGFVLFRADQLELAVASFRAALERDGNSPGTWNHLGQALHDLGSLEEAEAAYRQALALSPAHAQAHANLGTIHNIFGRRDEAVRELEMAHTYDPQNVNALSKLVELKKIGPGDPLFDLLGSTLKGQGASPANAMAAHFALGRGYDTAGRYEEAFAHYEQGHRARARYLDCRYDAAHHDDVLQRVRSTLTADFFRERADWDLTDASPIFVVGMPRSGTSLIEQILASHSLVHGAGELLELENVAGRLASGDEAFREEEPRPLPDFRAIKREDARAEGDGYLEVLHALGGEAARVVDKMPHNFERLWLVALLFPGATVLHAVRSPLDTCLSCYFQSFTKENAYTDDLTSLGHQYRYYRALMEHWKAVLPLEIQDVVYEELVTDPEAGIRALVGACGLEFEPACLSFHRTERAVRTASVTQVRRPVYTTSVGRWKKYRAHLGPLIEALEPLAVESGVGA